MRNTLLAAYCWGVVIRWMLEDGKSVQEIANALPKVA